MGFLKRYKIGYILTAVSCALSRPREHCFSHLYASRKREKSHLQLPECLHSLKSARMCALHLRVEWLGLREMPILVEGSSTSAGSPQSSLLGSFWLLDSWFRASQVPVLYTAIHLQSRFDFAMTRMRWCSSHHIPIRKITYERYIWDSPWFKSYLVSDIPSHYVLWSPYTGVHGGSTST